MKVVMFCGGLGLRLRDKDANVPKPLVRVGQRPLLWHLMNYYAHYGHSDFVLCLGYRGEAIKRYFLDYEETLSNDFILRNGGRDVTLLNRDIDNWTMTFVDTGLHSSIGERMMAVRDHVSDEDIFLANYSDAVTDLPLDHYFDEFKKHNRVAAFVSVVPSASFHFVETDESSNVKNLRDVKDAKVRINGGFFIFKKQIFDYMRPGEDLVTGAFPRLIEDDQLLAYNFDGFWQCMDTFKDHQQLEQMDASGEAPWKVWHSSVSQGA